MKLTFLGTGSAMPTGQRLQTGLLLEDGDEALLVDCGSGVLHGLATTEVGYEGVETVLLTHHHLDHVSDLLVLIKARWLAGEEGLEIVGPPGTEEMVTGLLDVHEYMQDRLDLQIRELEPAETPTTVAGFDVSAMWTRHSMSCLAYRFERGDGPAFVFSADSEAFEELAEFADGAALLVHDCSFPDEVDVSNHPTPTQLGRTLASADSELGRVYLTHLYPHTEGNHDEMLEALGDHYDGSVRFAEDGMTVDVS
ncbi:Ribonuclease BN, tRNA processing enzyme [Halovenus aranensis]|jgi:ribonuclease BN (tRNA processing enzyme)|uniref:Ribonuclease BN, tRNA processing enzyme n=1 Tax=Halovenus aranensis TaxID=890420 RepID=A0A1G8U670_9EURY|nr:MBL fold metallo-hydrolase [Halovenus aranensis]SDJ49316.1 Ribonuclease BN, tRNA processing enzyme [Halovenus aranensis]